ncbi:MAG TPA: M56 family metallopeptidase [Bacteroidales bacterium]|nr:M56 family metallopeptidase [Bacteroidales bacterium]
MNYIQYILIVSVCLGLFYTAYAVIFRKNMNFRHARIYLIASIILSLLIPLTRYKIETGIKWPAQNNETVLVIANTTTESGAPIITRTNGLWEKIKNSDPITLIIWTYLFVTILFILRILIILSLLAIRYRISYKVHFSDCVLLYNHGFRNTLSFFRWIFVQPIAADDEDLEQIITHEKIHVYQLHSFDILVIELLTAVMWFNPFVWMIKNSMQLVHEYLADDGALKTGINRIKYQALLINQIAEERLVILSSSFNHSLIKKRITMITKTKTQGKSLLKLLAILPVATLIFLLTSAFNGVLSEEDPSGTDTFSVVNTTKDYPGDQVSTPPDTIIKKTIIKKISKDNPNDTIVTEKEEIITGEDVIHDPQIIRHSGGGQSHIIIIDDDGDVVRHRDGERRDVRVRVENDDERHTERFRESGYSVHVIDGDAVIEEINETDDSVKHVKIITRRGADELDLSKDQKIIIRHSGEPEHSGILYIVDGINHTEKEFMNTINPDDIESMNVIKGEGIKKYTDKDYEGVIVITTKKGKKK